MIKEFINKISKRKLLTILFMLLVIINSAFIYLYFPNYLKEKALKAQIDKANTIADMAAINIGSAMFFEDKESMESVINSFKNVKSVYNMILFDIHNHPIFFEYPNLKDSCCLNYNRNIKNRFSENKELYTTLVPVIFNNKQIGKLSVCISLNDVNNTVAETKKDITLISIFVFLFGFISVLGISSLFVSPLKNLLKTVTKITGGDIASRVSISSQDEFGKLGISFNIMVDKLETALKELNKSKDELSISLTKEKELNDLKSKFISMISHEYRTPLTVIYTSSEIITSFLKSSNPEKIAKHIEKIQISVNFMTKMLEDVLTIGKSEDIKININNTGFDLIELTRNLIEDQKNIHRNGNIFNIIYDHKTLWVRTDERLIRHIMNNLISNSIKYSPYETNISIKFKKSASNLQIVFQDSGIGIPENDLKYLFETFHRGSNIGNIPGTGLGMSIVKKFVDQLNGEITVSSKLNEGTTFTLHFKEIVIS